ncbi:MAG: hypothetical protein COW42_13075 [Deltaproteobacteria bacterium CG17_big_fil_post_rev_8_21_14_2_50_63_7]|nr:MAG: hypothetical protein COW42_13075 [Deltaproteobacteria bacterium CG17_big_fil_post_rev_8_21_14_2_50_63_7]
MLCPIDGTPLTQVIVDALLPTRGIAFLCEECHGALLDHAAQSAVIGGALSTAETEQGLRDCPTCSEPMNLMMAGQIEVDGCTTCQHIWFDVGELLVVRAMIRKLKGLSLEGEEPSPLAGATVPCSDCGEPQADLSALRSVTSGLVCGPCTQKSGFQTMLPEVGHRTQTYRTAKVSITHEGRKPYRGAIVIDTQFDGGVEATLKPVTLWSRLQRRWRPQFDTSDPGLRDAFVIQTTTPEEFMALLKTRGPRRLLLDLAKLGSPTISIEPRRISIELDSEVEGLQVAQQFEELARRLHDCYERYRHAHPAS